MRKRNNLKLLKISFTIILVSNIAILTFMLPHTVSAESSLSNPIYVKFDTSYNGQATFTNEKTHTSLCSVKLVIPTGASPNSWAIALYPCNLTFGSFSSFSIYTSYVNATPNFLIYLDKNKDGIVDNILVSDHSQIPSNGQWNINTGGNYYGWDETTNPIGAYGHNWQPIFYWTSQYPNATILFLGIGLNYEYVDGNPGPMGLGQPLYADELLVNGIIYGISAPPVIVNFDQNGISTDYKGTALIVDNQPYQISQLPLTFNWSGYSNHSYSYQSLADMGSGKRYIWSNTSGFTNLQTNNFTVTASGTITSAYKTQYLLNISSSQGNPSGQGWYDSGTTATFSVTSPVYSGTETRNVFVNWTGVGAGSASNNNPNALVTMNNPITEIANWKTQYLISYIVVPPGSGITSPTGYQWVDNGTTQIVASANSGFNFVNWYSTTNSTSFSNVSSRITNALINSSDIILANFVQNPPPITSFNITITHVGSGTVSPVDGLYQVSSPMTLFASPASNFTFMGWLQNGTMLSTSNPFNYTATNNYVITAIFYDPIAKPTPSPTSPPIPETPSFAILSLILLIAFGLLLVAARKGNKHALQTISVIRLNLSRYFFVFDLDP